MKTIPIFYNSHNSELENGVKYLINQGFPTLLQPVWALKEPIQLPPKGLTCRHSISRFMPGPQRCPTQVPRAGTFGEIGRIPPTKQSRKWQAPNDPRNTVHSQIFTSIIKTPFLFLSLPCFFHQLCELITKTRIMKSVLISCLGREGR